ncbi:hypothetical protein [Roseivirga thermotolerans]|uniref:hypothetical protein n=1 Tax=Roseivirga thermotolerans TaxID=1758176 RepID=UPI0016789039|nr:hypothetical protein [Roseivirga thermotolerans]
MKITNKKRTSKNKVQLVGLLKVGQKFKRSLFTPEILEVTHRNSTGVVMAKNILTGNYAQIFQTNKVYPLPY